MAMTKEQRLAKGKQLAENFAASMSEDQRESWLSSVVDNEALILAFADSGLRQEEFSSYMNRLQTHRTELEEWQAKREREIADARVKGSRFDELVAAGVIDEKGNPTGRTAPPGTGGGGGDDLDDPWGALPEDLKKLKGFDPSKLVSRQDYEAALQRTSANSLALAKYLLPLSQQHQQEFGEILNIDGLIKFCEEHKLQMDRGGYESFVAERRGERSKEEQQKKIDEAVAKAREEEAAKWRAKHDPSAPPAMGFGQMFDEAGTLSRFNKSPDDTKDKDSKDKKGNGAGNRESAVDRAVARWNAEVAKSRPGGGA